MQRKTFLFRIFYSCNQAPIVNEVFFFRTENLFMGKEYGIASLWNVFEKWFGGLVRQCNRFQFLRIMLFIGIEYKNIINIGENILVFSLGQILHVSNLMSSLNGRFHFHLDVVLIDYLKNVHKLRIHLQLKGTLVF